MACDLFDLNQLDAATGHTFTITDKSEKDKCVVTDEQGSTISVGVFATQGQNQQALQETETACDSGTLTQQNIATGGYACEINGVPSAGALFAGSNVLIAASAVNAAGASSADVQTALVGLLQSFQQGAAPLAEPDRFTAQLTGAQTLTISGSASCFGEQLSGSSNVSSMDYDLDDDETKEALFLTVSTNNPTAQTGTADAFDADNNIVGTGTVTVSSSTAPTLGSPLGFSFSGSITLDAGGSFSFTGTGTCSSVESQ